MTRRGLAVGLLLSLYLLMQFKTPFGLAGFDLHQWGVLIVAPLSLLLRRGEPIRLSVDGARQLRIWYALLFWLIASIALNIWLGSEYPTLLWVGGDLKNLGLALGVFLTIGVYFQGESEQGIQRFLLFICIVVTIVSLLEWSLAQLKVTGVYETLFNPPIFERGGGFRGQGGYEGPNTYGAVLNIVQALLGMYAVSQPGKTKAGPILAGCLLVLPILWTGSRAAIAGVLVAAVAVVLWMPASRAKKARALVLLGALGVSIALIAAAASTDLYGIQRIIRTSAWLETDGDRRMLLWRSGLQIFADNPLIGIGLGRFVSVIEVYASTYQSPAHSEFIKLAAEAGVPGLILIVLLLSNPLLMARRKALSGVTTASWIGAALTVFVYHEFFFNYMFTSRVSLVVAALQGCLVAVKHHEVSIDGARRRS